MVFVVKSSIYSAKGILHVNMKRYGRIITAVFGIVVLPITIAIAQDLGSGATLYHQYCASCHGDRGDGRGPMTEVLTVKPSDLRTITTRHEGEFPRDLISRIISGDEVIAAHGTRIMPIWGERLQEDVLGTVNKPAVAQGRIAFLVDYLETLQGTEKKEFDNVVLPTTGTPPSNRP